jgi:hypothetical protein
MRSAEAERFELLAASRMCRRAVRITRYSRTLVGRPLLLASFELGEGTELGAQKGNLNDFLPRNVLPALRNGSLFTMRKSALEMSKYRLFNQKAGGLDFG